MLTAAGVPYLWANQTMFYPKRLVSEYEMVDDIRALYPDLKDFWGASEAYLTGEQLQVILEKIKPNTPLLELAKANGQATMPGKFTTNKTLIRLEVAVLVDTLLNLFGVEVDWAGRFKK